MPKWWRLSLPLNVPIVDAVQHGTPSTPEQEEPIDEAAAAGDTESP